MNYFMALLFIMRPKKTSSDFDIRRPKKKKKERKRFPNLLLNYLSLFVIFGSSSQAFFSSLSENAMSKDGDATFGGGQQSLDLRWRG